MVGNRLPIGDSRLKSRRNPQSQITSQSSITVRQSSIAGCQIGKPRLLFQERELDGARRAVALFGENQLCDAGVFAVRVAVVRVLSEDQNDDVRVLLEGA